MPGLPWFRMYAEAVDNDKLRLLAFEDRWHFVAILCCKSQGILDDHPQTLDRRMAVKLGVQLRELDEVRRRLMEVDLITEDWQPVKWNERQFRSDQDPTAAERKRRQRDRQKQKNQQLVNCHGSGHAGVTRESRGTTVTVTRTDTDTDTDTDKRNTTASKKAETDYPQEFEQAWKAYPRRQGDNPKGRALKAWNARIKEGHTAEEIQKGVEQYAEVVRTGGKEGTEYVKQAATFFGPDKPFLSTWKSEGSKKKKKEEQPWFMRGI